MIRPFHSASFQQISYVPPLHQLRRSSCHCSHCSSSNIKQITLPNQHYEILMHRKIRLANLVIENFKPTDKYLRSKNKYKNFRIFSHNRQQMMSPDNNHSPQKSPSLDQQDEIKAHSSNQKPSPMQSQYLQSKQSNSYFLNHLKTQMTRIDKNLNQLIQTSRQQMTEPDEPLITTKRTKQAIIKTIKTHHPYQSAYSIAINKRFVPPKKMHTTPSNLLARTQQSLSKYAFNFID
ncbi:unnamed protein product (macronuclear) [Paramecium tetraurelia]|uniref:Uncharacterized protein n=1 Tax=Paramecium tetraurelia TaxID=5888 RepID=A0BZA5_PARTE|nr:uncharacterized protein GSPATT00033725001 [Paramecium tetraurelia]CAK63872.1 unnamed protein product [Paramecium tetraurelia]|eukprot:XP_001431270.1 hypothetical protein (macronuclear) [Paramecium tetraurelia strain d4-2]